MTELTATRTLVKSPPELWAACSDPAVLGRHLEPFGEIRITRLEPERTVAWEGERASGTVRIEPAGWGTRVTLTAAAAAPEPVPQAPPAPGPAPPAVGPVPTVRRRRGGLLGWLLSLGRPPVPAPAPPPEVARAEPAVEPPSRAADPAGALRAALESLGQAHHRPFSRG